MACACYNPHMKQLESRDVLQFIRSMYDEKRLPRDGHPWHVYYLLMRRSKQVYPPYFTEDEVDEAIYYAERHGLTQRAFIEWVGEYLRRSEPLLFNLLFLVKVNKKVEKLYVPIYSLRDFGSLMECIACTYRMTFETAPSARITRKHIVEEPKVTLQLRRFLLPKTIRFSALDIVRENSRVAEKAFGRGVKDKSVKLLWWHVSNPHPVDDEDDIDEPAVYIHITESEPKHAAAPAPKRRIPRPLYVVLAIFFGIFGIHNLFAGRRWQAYFQFFISAFSYSVLSPLVWIWAIVEAVRVDPNAGSQRKDFLPWLVVSLLTFAFWVNVTSNYNSRKNAETPKNAPEVSAPATTPPADDTPQEGASEP